MALGKELAEAIGLDAGLKQATGAAKNAGFLLIILGLIHYALQFTNLGIPRLPLSLALFFISGYALASKVEKDKVAILVPMILFIVWYFFFGSTLDLSFWLFFGPLVAVSLILPSVLSKGNTVKPEIYGLISVLFFFLDLGFISFLVEELGLTVTPLLSGLILWMPWWALLGLMTLPQSDNEGTNALIGIVKVLGILYIIFVIIAPSIPNVGVEKSLLPQAEEFQAAQERLRESLPQQQNPFLARLSCIWDGEFERLNECIERKKIIYSCEKVQGYEVGTRDYQNCIEEEQNKQKNPSLQVTGVIDPTIRTPTKAEWLIDEEAFPLDYHPDFPYLAELKIINPRKLSIGLEVSCYFQAEEESVEGRIEPAQSSVVIEEEDFSAIYHCYPKSELSGKYLINFQAKLSSLVTGSRLERAFLVDLDPETKEKLRREEIGQVIKTTKSLAPAEFAVINFDLGQSRDEIIIEDKEFKPITLQGNIENLGKGRIIQVRRYLIDLPGFTRLSGSPDCFSGSFGEIKGKNVPIKPCILDYPTGIVPTGKQWERKEFEAILEYDYNLTSFREIKINEN